MSPPGVIRIEVTGLPAFVAFVKRVAEVADETDDFATRNALDDALEALTRAVLGTSDDAGAQP